MKFIFICNKCGFKKEFKFEIGKVQKNIKCEKCEEGIMKKSYKKEDIPDIIKYQDFGDDVTTSVIEKFKYGKMPTGREKIYF